MTATPTTTTDAEWARLDACHICDVAAGSPCRNKLPGRDQPRVRPHPERMLVVNRNPHGIMIMGRRARRPRTDADHAYHVGVGGVAACSQEPLAADTMTALPALVPGQRCRRPGCRRQWRAEEDRL